MTGEPSVAAAQDALEAGRWDEARSIFETALADRETIDGLMGLAEAWWWLGDPHRTVAHFERSYVLCRRAGDTDRAVWSALWLALTYQSDFGNAAAYSGWMGRAERALREGAESGMEGWFRLIQAFGAADPDHARRTAEQLLDSARHAGDFDLELCSMGFLGEIKVALGEVDAGLALIDEAMAGAFGGERTRFLTTVFTCCHMISACDMAADTERAAYWCHIADGFIQQYGCPFLHATCRSGYGNVLAATGHWAEAEDALNTAVRLAEDTFPRVQFTALARLADLRLNQGRLEEAEMLLSRVADHPVGTIAGARLRLARGEPAVAVAMLQRHEKHMGDHPLKRAVTLELLVEAQLAAEQNESAAETAERLAALAGQHSREVITARAARAYGCVLAAEGAVEEAIGRLEESLVKFAAVDLPLETARTRLQLARLLAETQPEVAAAEARTALASFEEIGAAAAADSADALLRSLGIKGRTGPKNVGVLTRRETEVLRLIGHGLTNPEIAERLSISRKTVSHHVSSVLSKLGLRTRTQAAAYATRMLPGDMGER